ncbi:MAG: GHKL domain-containing protein [Arthrospira sp. SH-MAG29]|nr:ATP-binding protein [Arthrospira sp. SH-MAG29]MBS0015114.1 GHKL domain-containing protein [Arthrospira sp. SH-MAG29]
MLGLKKNQANRQIINQANRQIIFPDFQHQKIGHIVNKWSISKKFLYSYFISIGIAVLGTATGLIISEHYQKQAIEAMVVAEYQQELLHNLEKSILAMRSHPQRLVPAFGKPVWFDYEKANFLGYNRKFQKLLLELSDYVQKQPEKLVTNQVDYQQFLENYRQTNLSYVEQINLLWEEISSLNSQFKENHYGQQTILNFLNKESYTTVDNQFDLLSEQLNQFNRTADYQYNQAIDLLRNAQIWGIKVIMASMFLSGLIATILAVRTNNAIIAPIKSVTEVANRVVNEDDFNLEAAVTTQDEAGLLAISLNKLIKWVKKYTEELEIARYTLEQRVEERTEELKEALEELKQTQSQLIQTEKMSGLGQMVAGIAHEINNPVGFIYGNTEHAKQYAEDLLNLVHLYRQHYPQPPQDILDMMEDIDFEFMQDDFMKLMSSIRLGANRIREIVLSLRNFSRLDEAEIKAVNLHDGLDSTLLLLNNRFKDKITIVKSYGNLPLIECYPAQINQVFMNIIANAIDALEDCQKNYKKADLTILIDTKKIEDNHVQIIIEDNGMGVPETIKDKIFNPFFTTKEIGKGTGLGLSICYKIIEKHRGTIDVKSETGVKTAFIINLPINFVESATTILN